MLERDHQESIPQDIYILGQLPRKVSFFSMLIDWVLNGLKGDTCYHSGQRPLSLPTLSDPQSNVSLHRTCQRSRRKIVPCQIILNRQDWTCTMGDLCTRQTFERFSCRIHSQSGIAGSNTGEIVICCPVSLEQQSWNTLQNSFCEQLSPLGFKLFPSLVVDLMHEFELGVLKSVLKHLVQIIYAIDPHKINILNERWALLSTQERHFFTTIDPSSILLGWAILMKRPMSFQVEVEKKIVDSDCYDSFPLPFSSLDCSFSSSSYLER